MSSRAESRLRYRDDRREPGKDELTTETTQEQAELAVPPADKVARLHALVSAAFGVVGGLALLVNQLQFTWPDLGAGTAFLSFGRLRPMAMTLLVFGWLAIAAMGAAYFIVPRLVGRGLASPALAIAGLVATSAGVVVGTVAIGAGQSQGLIYLEMPLVADVIYLIGLGAAVLVLWRTIAGSEAIGSPAVWFLVAALGWMELAFLIGAIPGFKGLNSALLNWFAVSAFLVAGLVGAATGAAYWVVGQLSGSSEPTRVGRIGFWSFAFVAAWLGPRFGVFGPAPDWLESVAVVFAFVLVIPVWAILADLAKQMTGRWRGGEPVDRFLLVGAACFALIPVHNLVQALRSPSSIVQFTGWTFAFELIVLIGAAGMWLAAFSYAAFLGEGRRNAHWWASTGGLAIAAFGWWAAGLQQGLGWLGEAISGPPPAVGVAFIDSVRPLQAWFVFVWVGIGIFALGQLIFAFGLIKGSRSGQALSARPAEASEEDGDDDEAVLGAPIAPGVLVRGSVALFVLAALAVAVVPLAESSHTDASLTGEARAFTGAELEGREVYISEGCMYCHTQQVRGIVTDVGLGPVSMAGDYANDEPHQLGLSRLGPDLMHVGSRPPTDSVRWTLEHLTSPRSGETARSWSIMPSYDYLSERDLVALSQYIAALK